MSSEDGSELSKNNYRINRIILLSLKCACKSLDEQKLKNILSNNDCTDCLESSTGYKLLGSALLSLFNKLKKEDSVRSEQDLSHTFMICKLLLENGVKINVETYLEIVKDRKVISTTPLHLAVLVKSEEIVKILLSKGAAVNQTDDSKQTPLMNAASKNYINIAKILLENGADPGNCDDCHLDNCTPLHIAVSGMYKEIVELLLTKVNSRKHDTPFQSDVLKNCTHISQFFPEYSSVLDYSNNFAGDVHFRKQTATPLHLAVLRRSKEIVEMLLSKGTDVNVKNNKLNTPLHYAVLRNCEEIAQLLLINGADLDIVNEQGKKPFDYSRTQEMNHLYSHYRIKMYLDNGGSIEEKDDDGYTLLHHAVNFNSIDSISFLLVRGCNVNAKSKLGESPLHLAIKHLSNEKITLLLLQNGADVNATTKYTGCIPLHLVVENDLEDVTLLKILIQNGANIQHKDNFGFTALNYAVGRQAASKAQLLLGENPDTSDKELKMAFGLSFLDHEDPCDRCRTPVNGRCLSELFFDLGFTLHVEDFENICIPEELYSIWLRKTVDQNFISIVQNFLNRPATSNITDINLIMEFQIIVGSVKHGFMDIFLNFSTPFMNVNARLQNGNTLLHYSCMRARLQIVEELLRRGANVNALNNNKESPLHFSIKTGHEKLTKLLLENGADVDACDATNTTPLFLAVETLDSSIVRLLLEHGANVNCVRNKLSPLHRAMYYHNKNIVQLLFHYGASVNPSDSFKIIPTYLIWNCDDRRDIKLHLELLDLVFNYGAKVINLSRKLFVDSNQCAKYKVKSIAANLENCYFSVKSSIIAKFQAKCLKEVTRMKLTEFDGCNISMYDLLVKSQRQTAMYMRNTSVIKMLDSFDFEEIFPIYAGKLRVCVRRGKLENRLLELSYHCLEIILKVKFPDVITSKIISNLNTSDLHRLIIASPIDNKKKLSVKYSRFIKSLKV